MVMGLIGCEIPYREMPVPVTVTISHFSEPNIDSDTHRFLPADEPVPVTVSWSSDAGIPDEGTWVWILGNYRGEILDTYTLQPDVSKVNSRTQFTHIIRIPSLITARKIHLRMRCEDPETGRKVLLAGSEKKTGYYTAFESFVFIRNGQPVFDDQWYPPETDKDGELRWWCAGSGSCSIWKPARSVFFTYQLAAPLTCFPDERWVCTVKKDDAPFAEILISQSEEKIVHLLPSESDSGSIVTFEFSSDQTFEPSTCHGNDDVRLLSFQVFKAKQCDFLPGEGFDLEMDPASAGQWIRPVAEARVPNPRQSSTLYIQGRIADKCLTDGQTLEVSLGGDNRFEKRILRRDFCWRIDVPKSFLENDDTMPVTFSCSPFFFPVECWGTEDEQPHGISISEIVIL
jgi:hypothetical protein